MFEEKQNNESGMLYSDHNSENLLGPSTHLPRGYLCSPQLNLPTSNNSNIVKDFEDDAKTHILSINVIPSLALMQCHSFI